jgi:NADH-quinone oxidoreductase subunit J
MSPGFALLALLTITSAAAAMSLRNLVHCALALAVTFGGLAAIYLQLNAEFVGFAQLLVYVGAVAILILFAALLTRGADIGLGRRISGKWWTGPLVGAGVFAVVAGAVSKSQLLLATPRPANPTVRSIGELLMSNYVLPLQVAGLLLTAALLGAVVLAMHETSRGEEPVNTPRPEVSQP